MASSVAVISKIKSKFTAMPWWVWMVAILGRTLFYFAHIPTLTPDSVRYLKQADHLFRGLGYPAFDTLGAPIAAAPPPGYSVFIALVYFLSDSTTCIRLVQLCLSITSCCLIYFSLRNKSQRLATLALVVSAFCPWTGRLIVYILSETFSIFAASVVVYCLSRFERKNATLLIALLAGLFISWLMLTAPATVPLGYAIFFYLLWKERRKVPTFLAILIAWLIPMIPWQMDCLQRTGKIQPSLYYLLPQSGFTQGATQWFKTWVIGDELYYFWNGPTAILSDPPLRAFDSEQEKELVLGWAKAAVANEITMEQYQQHLLELADERIHKHPLRYYIVLPCLRAFTLWLPMMTVGGVKKRGAVFLGMDKPEDEKETSAHNFLILLTAIALLVSYLALDFLFAYLAVHALTSRSCLAWLIVGSLFVYIGVSAYSGLGEDRRNFPFYPFLLFLATWVSKKPAPR